MVATAGLKKEQLADHNHKIYPRVDYMELAKRINATILNYAFYDKLIVGPALRRLETLLRSDVTLALAGFLSMGRHNAVLTMSERAGIPLAGMRKVIPSKKPFIFMFTGWSERQRKVIGGLHLLSTAQVVITKNTVQAALLQNELSVTADKIRLVPFAIDQQFFSPMRAAKAFDILSVGEVRGRDYKTLIEAVRDLDVSVHIAASGSWYAREKRSALDLEVPSNVSVGGRYLPFQLRERYAQSRLVVIPTRRGAFAGATTALEAMAMGIPVIASEGGTVGEYILDGETGILVEPENPIALREAIMFLLGNPQEARRLGENGRQRVEEELSLDIHVDRLAEIILETIRQAQDLGSTR